MHAVPFPLLVPQQQQLRDAASGRHCNLWIAILFVVVVANDDVLVASVVETKLTP